MAQDFGNAQVGGQNATLKYGVYIETANWSGKSVSEARAHYARLWNIPADADAHVGKVKVGENHTIEPGEIIEFHKKMGEKG